MLPWKELSIQDHERRAWHDEDYTPNYRYSYRQTPHSHEVGHDKEYRYYLKGTEHPDDFDRRLDIEYKNNIGVELQPKPIRAKCKTSFTEKNSPG